MVLSPILLVHWRWLWRRSNPLGSRQGWYRDKSFGDRRGTKNSEKRDGWLKFITKSFGRAYVGVESNQGAVAKQDSEEQYPVPGLHEPGLLYRKVYTK